MEDKITVELPKHVWRSVRSVVTYYVQKLDRKASRSSSATSAAYDRNRVRNLQEALRALDDGLSQ